MSRDSNVECANLHCNDNDKKHKNNNNNNKKKKKKNMSLPRFEPATYGFKSHLQIHYAMETNALIR